MATTNHPGRSFSVDTAPGIRINCFDIGPRDGHPIVVLHGLAGSAPEFFETARALPEFRTILIDLRGHGRSTPAPDDLSREAFVADVVHVIEAAADGPVTLAGQSLGGHTAMLVAAARPDLVSSLILLESGAGGGSERDNERLGDYLRSWPVPFPSRDAARAYLGDGALQQAWVADLEERQDGFWPRFQPDVMVAAINALIPPRWDEWESITAPTLVVYGERGMFTEHEKAEFTARGCNVRRLDLAGGSHDSHLDAFESWIKALRSVLQA
jgi:pimeloyl-ACP methyl ester carboxylesterase